MLCIFCSQERPPSVEHVFALAIGGTITTNRVCEECNSTLGTRVDAALSDFFPIRMRRAKLGLRGNNREPPQWYEMFLGEAKLVGQTANRVRTIFNEETGKLETRQLHHAENVVTPEGNKIRRITIDARDKDQIPTIISRERKRHGLPPLSDDELAVAAAAYTTNPVEQPLVHRSLSFSFAYLRHAMFKIAYELAFLWLGETYLSDPLARELRTAICDPDIASTDHLAGYVGDAQTCSVFKFWLPHEEHHLAYATVLAGQDVVMCIRIFDIYAAAVVVSRDAGRYLAGTDEAQLRFLALDSVSGRTIDTAFNEERHRIVQAMTACRRLPPFPDPLTLLAA